ncbi:ABC transporter permease [Nocardia sp. NPDC024068]|uniref:ABC transporter permease n=1 Tax=Nocardia sp. NPDC024068 TaxID=3157197 RepID=UPI0033E50DE2
MTTMAAAAPHRLDKHRKGGQRARGARPTLGQVLVTPTVLAGVLAMLYLWVQHRGLDSVEARALSPASLIQAVTRHLLLVGVSTFLVVGLAIPLGVVLTRKAAVKFRPAVTGVAVIGQSLPSFGLVVVCVLLFGIDIKFVILALTVAAFLPVLTNTIEGLEGISPELKESAAGIGMNGWQVLTRVELPLAVPVILAGLRTSLVWNVGTAAVAALAGAGGLGGVIVAGLIQYRDIITFVGAALTAILALLLDYLAKHVQHLLTPRGL